jgi:SAM-dependent methyltransferase
MMKVSKLNYRMHLGRFLYRSGRLLCRLGDFISSLIVVIMRSDELVKFTHLNYCKKEVQDIWGEEDYLLKGLDQSETNLLEKVPFTQGRVLLIGLGAGREAIPLAKMGFDVIGVDFVFELAAKAREYASIQNVKIEAIVQDITQLSLRKNTFDLVWFTNQIYSFIPLRTKRLDTLALIADSLKAEGYVLCSFSLDTACKPNALAEFVRKFVAVVTLGNRWYETGDRFTGREFIHTFLSFDEIKTEFVQSGFEVLYLDESGKALLKKRATNILA